MRAGVRIIGLDIERPNEQFSITRTRSVYLDFATDVGQRAPRLLD